ncbi:aldo/keto reductase [Magnetospira sp. QH-2]|uniref:aldo/keto reductase n=1 Tax=Magnetospira sp. (strain QH-2) TaxID=1288970 RepID=UPI00208F8619|nr:aldo/keto reductase [Magnetospira sp. QH-2]
MNLGDNIEYVRLGASGLKVSRLCLGTMMFGGPTEADDCNWIMSSARDVGVNFVDTADIYQNGRSEEVLADLIAADRDSWVLASKTGSPMGKGPNQGGLGRKWMIEGVEGSLRRLHTDTIDLLYLHRDDEAVPVEEVVLTLAGLIQSGKIRYWGMSNFKAWRIADYVATAQRLGVPGPVAVQPLYNILNRQAEVETLPASLYHGLGVVPYSPLARGVLSGKYEPGGTPPADSRAGRQDRRILQTEYRPESLVLAQQLSEHAVARGMTPAQFAFNWVLNNRLVASAIAGPRTFDQWTEYLGALAHVLAPEDEAIVDGLVPPGHASTPGYTDPAYPVRGRLARG